VTWRVIYHPDFRPEFSALSEPVADKLRAAVRRLAEAGPTLGRPTSDTLRASRFPNMKELGIKARRGEWRFAYAFDPDQQAGTKWA
jgi:hypothetical protein